jgi:hypothetical protein
MFTGHFLASCHKTGCSLIPNILGSGPLGTALSALFTNLDLGVGERVGW